MECQKRTCSKNNCEEGGKSITLFQLSYRFFVVCVCFSNFLLRIVARLLALAKLTPSNSMENVCFSFKNEMLVHFYSHSQNVAHGRNVLGLGLVHGPDFNQIQT